MDKSIALERARAEKKNPLIVWLANLVWPGLGNLAAGQMGLGIVFGVLEWAAIGITFVTASLGSPLLIANWVLASALGQSKINRDYARALSRIEQAEEAPAP
jgi:TM2 domain-containing membrane protein YozV